MYHVLSSTDVDSCIILTGGWGQKLTCPSGYVATGVCGSGGSYDCGWKISHRLQCCKIRVQSSASCRLMSTRNFVEDSMCTRGSKGSIKLVNEYCGSGKNRACQGGEMNQISCCEMSNLINDRPEETCQWKRGDYGAFLQCDAGYAIAGVCGLGKNRDCKDKSAHGIYCCKIE